MLRQRSATRRQTNQVRPDALISSEDLLVIKDTACAVNCQKKSCLLCLADVLRVLHNAVHYYTESGRLGMAAKQLRVRSTACGAFLVGIVLSVHCP